MRISEIRVQSGFSARFDFRGDLDQMSEQSAERVHLVSEEVT